MIDLVKTLLEYIKDKERSLGRKVTLTIFFILGLVAFNEYSGFTYYYPIAKEVEIISDIELAKASTNDPEIINFLNEKEKVVINRKYLHQRFIDLFNRNIIKKDVINHQPKEEAIPTTSFSEKIIKIIPEQPYRSQLWHTLSSTFIMILGSLILVGALIFQPFKKDQKIGMISYIILWVFTLSLCAGVIWLIQFLFGLIPVILNRAYINYAIPIILQIIYIGWILKKGNKKIK